MEAAQFPTNLKTYCNVFNISFFDLKLRCIFCKYYLSLTDLALFHEKQLSLIWKNLVCYACCNRCLCLSARYEADHYFQCACKVQVLHALLDKPLSEITVRCYYCYYLLDLSAKYDLISRDKSACLVRGHWRAPCRQCLSKELWV
ncbi:transforming protein [Human papillomavirus 141]|uniref:Protein E6 n=1 Tax=Human papillomavirus 141 TaxID=1070414 RepID=I3P6N1_9PAPI|nr:transforming protein [Human papillomavirus 141]